MNSDLEDKAKKWQRRRIPGRVISMYEGSEVRVDEGAESEVEWGERWARKGEKAVGSCRALSEH